MPGRIKAEDVEPQAKVDTKHLKNPHWSMMQNSHNAGTEELNGVDFDTDSKGIITNGILSATSPQQRHVEETFKELPPKIAQITANFQPLSKLFSRVAQECYNGLADTVTALADVREQHQVNGNVPSADHGPTSRQSAEKRLHWLEFANTHREKFIKLLVLFQWSRHVGEVSQLIDVFAWLREQEGLYEQTDEMMGNLKREMHYEKIPSPDIETALEILQSGQSSRIPDLGYIPPEPLSASKLLKTLTTVNTLLHIRLNLHESLPPHFRTFRIGSGRATFTVPGEFEVDLSIADEDLASQFWFIDFRFLFEPHSEIPAGQLRNQLEVKANEVLASSGLSGCYDFFHDFVLTYKINILRRQASELNRTSWAGSLRVEQIHRSLIVQYWVDRLGSKNWIEVGVHSGKSRSSTRSAGTAQQSRLGVKWVRGGKEAHDLGLTGVDNDHLDVEKLLEAAVSRHIEHILSSTRDRLAQSSFDSDTVSVVDKHMYQLTIPMAYSRNLMLCIEQTTGRMTLAPSSRHTEDFEERLNSHPDQTDNVAAVLVALKVAETSEFIQVGAIRSGWVALPSPDINALAWRRALAHTAADRSARIKLFKPSPLANMVLAALISPSNLPSWWITQERLFGAEGSEVPPTVEFLTDAPEESLMSTQFTDLQHLAITKTVLQANSTRLRKLSVPHSISGSASADRATTTAVPIMAVCVSVLLGDPDVADTFDADQVTMKHFQTLTSQTNRQGLRYIIRGRMRGSEEFLRHLAQWRDADTAFGEDGAFALQISATIDTPCVIDQVKGRLQTLSRLNRYLEVVRLREFRCTSATLNRIAFAYATIDYEEQQETNGISSTNQEISTTRESSIELSAEVSFTSDRITATFHPIRRNPHNHVQYLLSELLNHSINSSAQSNSISCFAVFAKALPVTLPVLLGLTSLTQRARIHARSLTEYRLEYLRPRCCFSIYYNTAQDPVRSNLAWLWSIEEIPLQPTAQHGGSVDSKLKDVLADFWDHEVVHGLDSGIIGLGKGIACGLDYVKGAIERLGAAVDTCEKEASIPDEKSNVDIAATTQEHEQKPQIAADVAVATPDMKFESSKAGPRAPTGTASNAKSNNAVQAPPGPASTPATAKQANGNKLATAPASVRNADTGSGSAASFTAQAQQSYPPGNRPVSGKGPASGATGTAGVTGATMQNQGAHGKPKGKAHGPEIITLD